MIIAYHLIWSVYGTWLPNDIRGSGSHEVGSPALAALGAPHYGRKTMQPSRREVREFYYQAQPLLAHPVIRLKNAQRLANGEALGSAIELTPYTCWACAVLPDHIHLVIRKHRHSGPEMIAKLQEASRAALVERELVPHDHPVWTYRGWHVFLDSPDAVRSRIVYVERNPLKEGLPPQRWPFVKEYDGWPHYGAALKRKRWGERREG